MTGQLNGSEVLVDEQAEASQIHNKGFYGVPQSGGAVRLDLMEALYLVESNRLEVLTGDKKMSAGDLLRLAHKLSEGFEIRYLVYRELRSRGYIVKLGQPPLDFRVFPRGGSPNKTPSKWWVAAISERWEFNLGDLLENLDRTTDVRKKLLLAVVDEESDVTYYEVRRVAPKGRLGAVDLSKVVDGVLMADRVLVLEPEQASALHWGHNFGKLIGPTLQLSLIEAAFLVELGAIKLADAKTNRAVALASLKKRARELQPDFDLRLDAFKDLKGKGLIVKTGFKYGSHFRAYEGDPGKQHARYLIHAVPKDYKAMWPEVSRAVRLAHGVKKEILLGRVSNKEVEYVSLSRYRP
ncbi:MAG: tRNA-intron lyase [Thermoplasmatota archaeon]|nr:tRNA-intron lyase [Candidatus Thermoplasmatota archaeon]MBU1915081.1 tRNA-intron lyase [Candidatus Thermoplasmatota archaeon]